MMDEKRIRIRMERDEEHEARCFNMFFFGIPFWLAIDVWVLNRPFVSSLLYSIGIAIVIFFIFGALVCLIDKSIKPVSIKGLIESIKTSYLDVMLFFSLAFVYYTVGAAFHNLVIYLASPSSGHTATVLITTLITSIIGIVLFIFRLKSRLLYGVSEIFVGLFIASYRAATTDTDGYVQVEFLLALLTAGVYLVVRGMDNVHQAMKQRTLENAKSLESTQAHK